jgi:hypothetical protein
MSESIHRADGPAGVAFASGLEAGRVGATRGEHAMKEKSAARRAARDRKVIEVSEVSSQSIREQVSVDHALTTDN